MNYTTLVADVNTFGSIANWVNRTDLDTTGVLTEAQAWIYAQLRTRQMVATATLAIATSVTSVAEPTGFLDPIVFTIPAYGVKLINTDVERFESLCSYDDSGLLPSMLPTRYCQFGGVLNLNSRADRAYTGKMIYYRSLAALSPTNLSNFLTDRYPTLLRKACLMIAYDHMKERSLMEAEEARAYAMAGQINVEADNALRSAELDYGWDWSN
jgi:hypothetical protein